MMPRIAITQLRVGDTFDVDAAWNPPGAWRRIVEIRPWHNVTYTYWYPPEQVMRTVDQSWAQVELWLDTDRWTRRYPKYLRLPEGL